MFEERRLARCRRIIYILLILAIAAGCLLVLQKSFHFVTKGPLLNVDDSIPNVGVTLAEHGRYGFLSSPTQGLYEVDRTHAFFNYGPLYFYLAAFITWLIGPSLTAYRMLHPFGLVAIVVACAFLFRRFSLVGPALAAVAIFQIYLQSHWPMARPDIMVSICAVLMMIAMADAIKSGRWWSWFTAGFFACSVVTTHQIAAVMIPASGFIWVWSIVADRQEGIRPLSVSARASLTALVIGGAAGALVYLVAIDFRVRDLWELGHAGLTLHARPFLETLKSHFDYAWGSTPKLPLTILIFGYCGALALSLAGFFLPPPWKRKVMSLVMPPLVVSAGYQFSLGFYGNNHSGYVILSQVATIWAIASMASVVIAWIRERFGQRGQIFDLFALGTALILIVTADLTWARSASTWEARGAGNVDMNEYVREVESALPEGAATWGSLYFGLDAGDRTNLVQFNQMFRVIHDDFSADRRSAVAPDFVVLSSYETDTDFARNAGGFDTYIENFISLFPKVGYRTVRLVYAPPYGVTREYRRALDGNLSDDVDEEPSVAVNDGASRQWSTRLGPPLQITFALVEPVTVHAVEYSINTDRKALVSLMTDLPAGFFLVDVALDRSDDADTLGFVSATPSRYFYWHGGWSNFTMPAAPYFPGEKHVCLLVDHLGGPLYVSRFERVPKQTASVTRTDVGEFVFASSDKHSAGNPAAVANGSYGMRVISVRRVSVLTDQTGRIQPFRIPPWSEWTRNDNNLRLSAEQSGKVRIAGRSKPGAWLLQSPMISVAPHEVETLALPTEAADGAIDIGVLGSDGSWLAPPTQMPRRVAFNTSDSSRVSIVILNNELGRERPFEVLLRSPVMLPVRPQKQYVDDLMACRSPYLQKTANCAK